MTGAPLDMEQLARLLQRLPPPITPARENDFEIFVLVLGVLAGYPLLFGAPVPGSTTELLGPVRARVWAWLLVGGCAIALTGAYWTWWGWISRWIRRWQPRTLMGLMIEQVGLVAMGGSSIVYAYGVASVANFEDLSRYIAGALVLGMGLAGLRRARRIRRWIRGLEQAVDGTH